MVKAKVTVLLRIREPVFIIKPVGEEFQIDEANLPKLKERLRTAQFSQTQKPEETSS